MEENEKIILITYEDNGELMVSHGIGVSSLKTIILPNESVEELGCYDYSLREWTLRE